MISEFPMFLICIPPFFRRRSFLAPMDLSEHEHHHGRGCNFLHGHALLVLHVRESDCSLGREHVQFIIANFVISLIDPCFYFYFYSYPYLI